ncbi:hypothetical protein JCM10213v2_008803 [Rhodosporidiobolus nylandii]
MFYCSPEHQKLLWFVHKRVCGPSAQKPHFRFPPLTATEARLAKENLHAPWAPPNRQITLAKVLLNLLKSPSPVDLPALIDGLTTSGTSAYGPERTAELTCYVRDAVFQDFAPPDFSSVPPGEVPAEVYEPITGLSNFAAGFALSLPPHPAGLPRFYVREAWYTQLMHRMLTYHALKYLIRRQELGLEKTPKGELERCYRGAMSGMGVWLGELAKEGTDIGGAVLRAMDMSGAEPEEMIATAKRGGFA